LHAGESCIPQTFNKRSDRVVPGWTDYVATARFKSIFWHKIWEDCGHPNCGIVADTMRRTRAAYHYAIISVRKNEAAIVKQRFANSVLCNRTRNLWNEVHHMKCTDKSVSSIVDGFTDCSMQTV